MSKNFLGKLLRQHAEKLERDSEKLRSVRSLVGQTLNDPSVDTDHFWEVCGRDFLGDLEQILGTD